MATGVDAQAVVRHLTKFSGELILDKSVMAVQIEDLTKEVEELRAENAEYKKALELPNHVME